MAAFVALGNILGNNAVSVIFDFLDDASVAATDGMDVGNIHELRYFSAGEPYQIVYWHPTENIHVLYWDSHCPNKFGIH